MARIIKSKCALIGSICIMNSIVPNLANDKNVLAKKNEVKAAWVATVFSLDYPSVAQSSAEKLRADVDFVLKEAKEMGFNTLFFQVRPSADAFYKSERFPWSQYLTGNQGMPPTNEFDPFEYLIAQAHAKGIKVHAWINPYRVTASEKDAEKQCSESIAVKYPQLVVKHTNGKLYLNPGEPEANQLIIDGAVEIVKKYSVDGIHIDDYFYPGSDFPDGETFTKYGGKFSDIGDWRRNNTYELIKGINDSIKKENESIVFSVSPCGIWANKSSNPDGSNSSGVQAYYDYYADTKKWAEDELVDWIVPQIYWEIGNTAADFEEIAKWWNSVVSGTDVRLCIGQAAYKISDETDIYSPWYSQNGIEELSRQARIINSLENVSGYAYYRLGSISENTELKKCITKINTEEQKIFSDIEAYPWAEEAIAELYERKIVNGMNDGTFGCARNVTRADFTVMLTRMMDKTAEFTDNFLDVTKDKYYYNEVGIAKALGYVSGRGDNLFDPVGEISRQDMAVMAYRVLEKENKIKYDKVFNASEKISDFDEVADYAKEAVSKMVENGYLNGYETGEFKPEGKATRAEATVFLYNIIKNTE